MESARPLRGRYRTGPSLAGRCDVRTGSRTRIQRGWSKVSTDFRSRFGKAVPRSVVVFGLRFSEAGPRGFVHVQGLDSARLR